MIIGNSLIDDKRSSLFVIVVHFKWLLTRLFVRSRSCTSRAKTLPGDHQDGLEDLGEDHDELLSWTNSGE
jgi:hypothetical protein